MSSIDITSLLGGGTTNVVTSSAGYSIFPSPPVIDVTRQIIAINEDPTLTPQQKADKIASLSGISFAYTNDPNNAQVDINGNLITNQGVNSSGPLPQPVTNNFLSSLFGGPALVGVDPSRITIPQPADTPATVMQQTDGSDQLTAEQIRQNIITSGQYPNWTAILGASSTPPITNTVNPSSTQLGATNNSPQGSTLGGIGDFLKNNAFIIIIAVVFLILMFPSRPNVRIQRVMSRHTMESMR